MQQQHQKDGLAIGFWFIVTLVMVNNHTPFEDHVIDIGLLLWGIGWLTTRFVSNALARHGRKAGWLLLQLGIWFMLFLGFFPAVPAKKILILWGIALPLLFLGSAARWAYVRLPKFQKHLDLLPRPLALIGSVSIAFTGWAVGFEVWVALSGAIIICVLAAIPLYYGWQLAEPVPGGERDARFGTSEQFRAEGMSHDL